MNKYNADNFDSGKALQKARKQLDKTQGQFAIMVGEDTKTIENAERRGIKKIDTYLEWCDKLGCDIDFLLGVQKYQKKDSTDIHTVTGLSESACSALLEEMTISKLQQVSPVILVNSKDVPEDAISVPKDAEGISSGVKTVDLFNAMSGDSIIGKAFKESMLQYITELSVNRYLETTLDSVVCHYNSNARKNVTVQKAIEYASTVFASIRRVTSLQGLTMTGMIQSGVSDDLLNFCEEMKKEGFSESESRFFYYYIQSKGRLDALKLDCYDKMVQFLVEMSEGSQLSYFNSKWGSFDVSPTQLVTRTDEYYISKIIQIDSSLEKAEDSIAELYEENERLKKEVMELKSGIK